MDAGMLVERMRVLVLNRAVGSLAQLCECPQLQAVAAVVALVRSREEIDMDAVEALLRDVKTDDPREMLLTSTEIDPKVAAQLSRCGIVTLGDLAKATDTRLLTVKWIKPRQLSLLRAVERKYLAASIAQKQNGETG